MDKFKKTLLDDMKFFGHLAMTYQKEVREDSFYANIADLASAYTEFIDLYAQWLTHTRRRIKSKVLPDAHLLYYTKF